MRQLILDIRPDAPAGFDNFLPGPNAEALAAIRELSAKRGTDTVMYLWGESGVGKSHLLQAWASSQNALFPSLSSPLPERPPPHLAVDDVDRRGPEDQIRLFSLINAAREGEGVILAAGNLPPAQLAVRPDLATRLAQGLVFRLYGLSDADKAAALQIRAEARGLPLPEEVIRYLLTHSRRDLPSLLALVDDLDSFSLSRKRVASVPLLKEMLQRAPARIPPF
jgi:DnaA family protein